MMIRKNDTLVGKFDSLAAFVDYASQPLSGDKSREIDVRDFTGTRTFEEAVSLSAGWTEGAKRIEAAAARINVKGERLRKTVAMREAGPGVVSMGHFMAGHPQPYAVLQDTNNARNGKGKVVKIMVNLSASGMVDHDVIETRGAAVVALAVALERAGRRVEIVAVHSVNRASTRRNNTTAPRAVTLITLKAAQQRLNLPSLAFGLMHPSMLRRFIFSARKINPDSRRMLGLTLGNNAMPCDIEAPENTVYLGALKGWEKAWESPENAHRWVIKTLGEQGVTLK